MSLFSYLPELGFFLGGTLFPNNSRVLLSDIGEGSSALFCLTDREACCSEPRTRGAWDFPNRTRIDQISSSDVYFVRGSSFLQLNIKNGITGPTGKYTCLIPSNSDGDDDSQSLYVGIFNENEGTTCICALFHIGLVE